jgi:twitching motility protein PilT
MQSDTTGSLQEFHKILEEAGKKGASDIHYVPKEQLLLRIDVTVLIIIIQWKWMRIQSFCSQLNGQSV